MKYILNFLLLVLMGLVLFFGVGPVLLADGSMAERLITLAVVIIILAVLAYAWLFVQRRFKAK